MSRFFVGQPVRLIRPLKDISRKGMEFRIKGFGFWPRNDSSRLCDCTILLNSGKVVAEFQIEPILDQHQPCESEFKESLDHLLSKLKGVEA